MTGESCTPVAVSRQIRAPAGELSELLAEPARDLTGARDLGVRYSHQVTDLPQARAETIQYDRHRSLIQPGSTPRRPGCGP